VISQGIILPLMGTILSGRAIRRPLAPGQVTSAYLSRLWLGQYSFEQEYYFDGRLGTPVNSIGVLLRGRAEFVTPGRRFELGSGEAVFVPHGERYESYWRGDLGVEWHALHFVFSPEESVATALTSRRYQLQQIAGWDAAANRRFREIAAACTAGGAPTLAALGHFYLFYADLVQRLAYNEITVVSSPVQAALHYIEAHPCEDFSVAWLASLCCMTESRFYAAFAIHAGCTPIEYKNRIRIQRAVAMLSHSDHTVESISRELNFCTPAYFRRVFKRVTGKTPREYRFSI